MIHGDVVSDDLNAGQIAEITAYVDIHVPPPDVPTAILLFGTNQAIPARIAADRHRRGLAPLIIATGGVNRHDGTVEGQMFHRLLREADVAEDAIRYEDRSANTWQNVEFALEHLAEAAARDLPITVVSKRYHRRAVHAVRTSLPELRPFYAIGWEPLYAALAVTRGNWPSHPEGRRRVIREWQEIPRRVAVGEISDITRRDGAWR